MKIQFDSPDEEKALKMEIAVVSAIYASVSQKTSNPMMLIMLIPLATLSATLMKAIGIDDDTAKKVMSATTPGDAMKFLGMGDSGSERDGKPRFDFSSIQSPNGSEGNDN